MVTGLNLCKRHKQPIEWTDKEVEAYYLAALEECRYIDPSAYAPEDIDTW